MERGYCKTWKCFRAYNTLCGGMYVNVADDRGVPGGCPPGMSMKKLCGPSDGESLGRYHLFGTRTVYKKNVHKVCSSSEKEMKKIKKMWSAETKKRPIHPDETCNDRGVPGGCPPGMSMKKLCVFKWWGSTWIVSNLFDTIRVYRENVSKVCPNYKKDMNNGKKMEAGKKSPFKIGWSCI